MISCIFFSLCDHDSFSSSITSSIFRLFLRRCFSKSFRLSLISFKSDITGCCCWCFWFCNNSFFKLSRVLNFLPTDQYESVGVSLVQLLHFSIQLFLQLSHWFFCLFVEESSWKTLLLIAHKFVGYLSRISVGTHDELLSVLN